MIIKRGWGSGPQRPVSVNFKISEHILLKYLLVTLGHPFDIIVLSLQSIYI